MSKYKMPIIISTDRSKQFYKKLQKYKLPILKDQPLQQHNYSISSSSSHIMKMQKLKLCYDYNNDETNLNQRSLSQNNRNQNQPINRKSAHNISQQYKLNSKEKQQNFVNDQPISSQLQINNIKSHNKIQRYHSNMSQYSDQTITNGALEQKIQQDIYPRVNRRIKQKLPIINERSQQKVKRQNFAQLWQQLFKELQQYRKPQKKKRKPRNYSKTNEKRSKSELKKIYDVDSDRQCRQIEKQLKNLNINNSLTYNYQLNGASSQNVKTKNGSLNKRKSIINDQDQESKTIANAQMLIGNIRNISKQMKPSISFYINSYQQIKIVNPFFRKINQLGGCILLNIGNLTIIQTGKKLYSEGESLKNIYILIYGKIILTDKHKINKKLILTGQTLGQESLFENDKPYHQRLKSGQKQYNHKYQAKILNKSCLLSLQLSKYYKISRELSKMGYKQLFNLIDNLFRINYINKQNSFNSNKIKLNTEQ